MKPTISVHRERDSRIARLEERYRHELLDSDERLELREQIVRLKKKAGRS